MVSEEDNLAVQCVLIQRFHYISITTCCSNTHDVTNLLQVGVALKQVRLDQPELPGAVQLAHHLQDLAQEETETTLKVAALKLNG